MFLGDDAHNVDAMRNSASLDDDRHEGALAPHPVYDVERDGVLTNDGEIAAGDVPESHRIARDLKSTP